MRALPGEAHRGPAPFIRRVADESPLSSECFCPQDSPIAMADINTGKTAKLDIDGKVIELPIVEGTEQERGLDISKLRANTGYITLDDGYGNTGSCQSAITFIDGEKGILRYRGIPIEELAEKSTFVETAYLIIYGELPTSPSCGASRDLLTENELLHEDMKYHFEGFPPTAHPMAILSAMINAASCFYPGLLTADAGATSSTSRPRG